MALALEACALGVPPSRSFLLGGTSTSSGSFEATLGERSYSWTVCSYDHSDYDYGTTNDYANPLWPNGYEWVKLPKNTHLLLYGKSSMAQLASALRAGSQALGVHEKTVTFSATRDCHVDEGPPPVESSTCETQCGKYASLGPSGESCGQCREWDPASCAGCYEPHGITVDYFAGGSTITTIANHAQSQRLEGRLEEYLSMVSPRQGKMSTHAANKHMFTHAAYMGPHSDHWFDKRCEGTDNEPGQIAPVLRTDNESKGEDAEEEAEEEEADEEEGPPGARLIQSRRQCNGLRCKLCRWDSDALCPRQHPHFSIVSRWVEREVAAVLEPPRNRHMHPPFQERLPAQGSAAGAGAELPNATAKVIRSEDDGVGARHEAIRLRCVTDEQLQHECPHGRNTTVWLGQSKLVYEWEGAAERLHLPMSPEGNGPACLCGHLCNARCAVGGRCHAGPGLAAAWLVLRAVGLAGTADSHSVVNSL